MRFSCFSPLPDYENFLLLGPLLHPTLPFCPLAPDPIRILPSFLRALVSSADPSQSLCQTLSLPQTIVSYLPASRSPCQWTSPLCEETDRDSMVNVVCSVAASLREASGSVRLTGTSVQNGAVCCVSYLCAELYSRARLPILSCGLGVESVPRTLPLPDLIFATPVPSDQFTVLRYFGSWELLRPLNTSHTQVDTHTHNSDTHVHIHH